MAVSSSIPPPDLLAVVRLAARRLTPVVVDLGPGQPLLHSFVDSVQGRGRSARFMLSPIASNAIPKQSASWIQISSTDEEQPWALNARKIEPLGATDAVVELRGARLVNNTEAPFDHGLTAANDSLILVVPGGIDDRAAYVFPISQISATACTVEATSPLEPSTELSLVEIIGDRRLLREASARVEETIPWLMPNGSRRFRCRLTLRPTQESGVTNLFDRVTDARQVRRLVDFAGMMTAVGWYEIPGKEQGTVRFLRVEQDSATLEVVSPDGFELAPSTSIRIGLDIFAVHYEMVVRVLERHDNNLRVTLPLVLRRRRRHRRAERIPVPTEETVVLSFRNPATGHVEKRLVSDISFVGLSFPTNDSHDVLWSGLPLEQAELDWHGKRISLGDLDVRATVSGEHTRSCHTSITKPGIANDPVLIDLLATLAHPDITVHGGQDFTSLINIYIKAGLFAPFMHRNLEPMVERAKSVWSLLHSKAPDVVRTLVHGPDHDPDGAVTVMRAWERAWIGQHLVSVNPEIDGTAGKLQLAYLDHILPRPDGHFLVFFVKADNRIMNAFYERFFATTGTPESVERNVVQLWSRKTENPETPAKPDHPPASFHNHHKSYRVRPLRPGDENLVSRSAIRLFGFITAAGLSLLPGELFLPDTSHRFSKAGLKRSRTCRLVTFHSQPVYAIIEERMPPGLNLTWMLNSNWIIPIHPELDKDNLALFTALDHIIRSPSQSPIGDRFLNVPLRIPPDPLLRAGFEKEADVNLNVFSRAGLQHHFQYAASRYGELAARVLARNIRRVSLAPS